MENDHRPVSPARPAAPYVGGKKLLAGELVRRIEAVEHDTYVEPFVGMGGVFLRRRSAPKLEVINDVSGDVATFFRILQRHFTPFVDMLRWQVTGRREFERLMAADPKTLTDLERAARFLYLQRVAYAGKVAGRTFGVSPNNPARFDPSRLVPLLADLHERLAGVVVENLSYAEVIRRYDSPRTLFYLDPPYEGSETVYGKGVFGRADFANLAEVLAGISGSFLLSINDSPAMRSTFTAFAIEETAVTYSMAREKSTRARELIVSKIASPA